MTDETRLERVDAALATQLGRSIAINAKLKARIERLETALRRIRSLDEQNVVKYARQIADAVLQ
jgi:hypothetical protein